MNGPLLFFSSPWDCLSASAFVSAPHSEDVSERDWALSSLRSGLPACPAARCPLRLPGRLRTFRLGAVDAGGRRRDLSRRRVWLVARVLRKEDALAAPVTRGSAERAIDAALFDPHGRKRKFS